MLDQLSDDSIVTIAATTPSGVLWLMATVAAVEPTLKLTALHVQGARRNAVGPANLRVVARAFMEWLGCDAIIVQGAARSTGANIGRRSGIVRLTK